MLRILKKLTEKSITLSQRTYGEQPHLATETRKQLENLSRSAERLRQLAVTMEQLNTQTHEHDNSEPRRKAVERLQKNIENCARQIIENGPIVTTWADSALLTQISSKDLEERFVERLRINHNGEPQQIR